MPPVKFIDGISYLLHDFDDSFDDVKFKGITVVKLGAQTPEILKLHFFDYSQDPYDDDDDDEIGRIMAGFIEIRKLASLNCKILTQGSQQYVSSKKEAIDILKRGSNVFGVWGKKQYDIFSKFSLRVVDLSTPILDEMVKRRSEQLPRKKRFNFCKLSKVRLYGRPVVLFFCDLLSSKLVDFKYVSEEHFREVFEKWVENKAWFSMVRDM